MKKSFSILFTVIFAVFAISITAVSANAAEELAVPEITGFENVANGVKISWNSVDGAAKYRVFYKGKTEWKKLGDTAETSITDDDVKSGSTYTYTICCIDSEGNSLTDFNENGWKQTFVASPKITSIESVYGGVKLEWEDVSGADRYMVMYNGKNGWRSMEVSDTTSLLDKDVKSGNSYTYSVRSLDSNGNAVSGYNTSGWTVKYLASPAITRFENVNSGVKIYWDKVSGIDQYRVFYKGKSGWKVLGTTKNTSIVDDDVNSGSTYTYTIRGLDSKGNTVTGYNNTGWKQTFVAAPKITDIYSAYGGVKIEWNKVKGADSYMVMYKGRNGWRSMESSNTTSLLDKDVKSGNSYTYSVRAIDKNGNAISGYNTTGKTVKYIAAPGNVKTENVVKGVKISWSKVSQASKYRVFYKTKDGWKGLGTTSGTSMLDEDVSSNHTYTYTVRCLDSNDNFISGYNGSGWKRTFYDAPIISKTSSTKSGVKIEWIACRGVKRYEVYYKSKSGWKSMGTSKTTSFVDKDVKDGSSYTYAVRSVDEKGNNISGMITTGWKHKYQKSGDKKPTNYYMSKAGSRKLKDVMGFDYNYYMKWLDSHDNESSDPDYYIDTYYKHSDHRVPNGAKGAYYGHLDEKGKTGTNCTGFVWHVLYEACTEGKGAKATNGGYFCGNHMGGECQYRTKTGVIIPTLSGMDGISWGTFYNTYNVERYYFKSKEAMLASGKLKKGDIIWQYVTDSESALSNSHHIGIYYGDGSSDVFWHCGYNDVKEKLQNCITNIGNIKPTKLYCVLKVS